jgi:hypothetical protein
MMRTAMKLMVLLLLIAIGGCAPPGPPFASVAGALPPVPPGMARIFIYRSLEPYETLAQTTAYLNDAAVGVTEPGAVLYRDVAPGQYTIAVKSIGVYPDQFKTVTVEPGQVLYARVDSLRNWSTCGSGGAEGGSGGCWDTFVVELVDPRIAQYEMRSLRFIPG